MAGEEEIRGRKAWVIESTPQAGRAPASQHEREVLSLRRKLWIAEAGNVPLRIVCTVIGDGIHFAKPGSTIRVDFDEIGLDVWNQSSLVLEIWRQSGKAFEP